MAKLIEGPLKKYQACQKIDFKLEKNIFSCGQPSNPKFNGMCSVPPPKKP